MSRHHLDRPLFEHLPARARTLVNLQIRSVTASSTFEVDEDQINANAAGGAVICTLPAGSDALIGKSFAAVKTDATANAVSIARAGTDTIEGGASVSTTVQHARLEVYWDGSMWRKLGAAAAAADAAAAQADATDALTKLDEAVSLYSVIGDILSASAETGAIEVPAGTIARLSVTPNADPTVGNLVVTFSLGGVPITNGVVTIAPGSGANVPVGVVPSALNVAGVNDVLSWVVSGGNTAAGRATIRAHLQPA